MPKCASGVPTAARYKYDTPVILVRCNVPPCLRQVFPVACFFLKFDVCRIKETTCVIAETLGNSQFDGNERVDRANPIIRVFFPACLIWWVLRNWLYQRHAYLASLWQVSHWNLRNFSFSCRKGPVIQLSTRNYCYTRELFVILLTNGSRVISWHSVHSLIQHQSARYCVKHNTGQQKSSSRITA